MRRVRLQFFFFSSRRRHTRCSRDWSSDVCSSDLPRVRAVAISFGVGRGLKPEKCAGSSQGEMISRTRRPFLPSATKANTLAATIPIFTSSVLDRKSTRLNSSHGYISYAVFCLKKKKKEQQIHPRRVHRLLSMRTRQACLHADDATRRSRRRSELLVVHLI